MASAVDSRLAYARLSAVATASRLPTANRGSNNSYTTSWDTTGKHDGASRRRLYATWCRPSRECPGARVWTEGGIEQYQMRQISVMRFALNWMRSPDFANAFGEPDA